MQIERVRHDWPEPAGFTISRPSGYPLYTFLHFQTPVELELDGKTIQAPAGTCIFFAPGVPQYFRATQPLIHNWIHVDGSLAQRLPDYDIPENRLLQPKDAGFISELFQRIEAEHFSDNPYKEQLLEHYLDSFLILLSRALKDCSSAPMVRENEKLRMRSVRKTVLSQPEKHWTVAQMAAIAAMSQSRFHVTYKAYFGSSPMQDVIEAKLRQAKTLLVTRRELSVAQIAQALGYTNEYHFIRLFKATHGMTPGAYRRSCATAPEKDQAAVSYSGN